MEEENKTPVVEEIQQEAPEAVEPKEEVKQDFSKFESKEDDSVYKVDLSTPKEETTIVEAPIEAVEEVKAVEEQPLEQKVVEEVKKQVVR